MKKILSIIVLLAGVMAITSCSNDDATYTATPKLEITNANVLFEAIGGTGTITVNTTEALTATTESNWVTLSVSGNTVNIVAQENTTLTSRSATIKLKAGDTEAQVSATQKGGTYGLESGTTYSLNDDARTLNLPLVHTSAVEVKSLADWITASFDDEADEFVLQLAENDSGWRRTGKVAFETGNIQDTITVTQWDFLKDIQGTYGLVYYSSGKWTYTLVELERTSETDRAAGQLRFLSGTYAQLGITIPVVFDESNYSISIFNLVDLGVKWTYKDVEYDLMTMINYTNGSSIYRNKNPELAAIATMEEDEDGIFFNFDANEVMDHEKYTFYALRIGYTTGGYEGYTGAFVTFPYCYLMKL